MRSLRVPLALAVAGLALTAAPAAGQEPVTVEASEFQFTPGNVTVSVGQAVRFTNVEGFHNVHFDGEDPLFAPAAPDAPVWLAVPSKTFTAPGEYRYVCDPHEIRRGMIGTVTVQAPPPPPPPPPPGPTDPPAPGPTPPPSTPSAPAAVPGAVVERLEVAGTRFCTRSRSCRRPGVVLRIELTAPGALAGRLAHRPLNGRRRFQRYGRVDFGTVPAGPRNLRFSSTSAGRSLKPGRYRMTTALDGRAARTLRFVVRRS